MERTIQYIPDSSYENKPIGFFLKSMGFSSKMIVALKKMPESILINEKWEYINYKLQKGDILKIHIQENISSPKIVPVELPFPIIYEDEDLLVINKPADMPIHPSMNNYDNSLANSAAYYFASQNLPYVFRCVNRLDRNTTGLTILAKHQVSAGLLSAQVTERNIHREYRAILSGCIQTEKGTISEPIGRKDGSTIERCIDYINGETAITHYETIKKTKDWSFLSIHLETGRTHQIRVHMKHIGHPLLGDSLYNPDYDTMTSPIVRQALHSYKLSFRHPITGHQMEFIAPLPEDMSRIVERKN